VFDGLFAFVGSLLKAPFICIGWVVLGLVAGALANQITGGKGNACSNFVLGIAGAVIGGFISGGLGLVTPNGGLQLYLFNLLIATATAAALIFLRRAFMRR